MSRCPSTRPCGVICLGRASIGRGTRASIDRPRCACARRRRGLHERASWPGPLACALVTKVHPYGGRCSRWGALIHDRLPGLLAKQAPAADRLLANHKRSDGE
jgi:hypothetical protein